MKALMIGVSLALLGGTAHADQCAWIDATIAERARSLLAQAPLVVELCEPCGDKAPGAPVAPTSVEIRNAGDAFKEVYVNGKPVDLAYVFIKHDDSYYRNVADLAGCAATGVSDSLRIDAETPNGVLIVPAGDAFPPVTDHVPRDTPWDNGASDPKPPPAAAPQVPAASVTYVYTTTQSLPWPVIGVAAASGFITGAAFAFVVLVLRRRRHHAPRI